MSSDLRKLLALYADAKAELSTATANANERDKDIAEISSVVDRLLSKIRAGELLSMEELAFMLVADLMKEEAKRASADSHQRWIEISARVAAMAQKLNS